MLRPFWLAARAAGVAAITLIAAVGLTPEPTTAQTNVRARYADGQVWVAWQEDPVPPTTYAIYAKSTPFLSTNNATLVGRLFRQEWLPLMLAEQTGGAVDRWRIPDGTGAYDTLAVDEGLFVETAVASGTRWYAVVAYGDTLVTPGVNRVGPVTVTASLADAPECHLQLEYVQNAQWLVSVYSMWADGREAHWLGRPDFPVMANAHKNGMPSLFYLSRPLALPAGPRPLVHWFHGGGGTASQSIPGRRPAIDIDPVEGFLCAQNDDFIRELPGAGVITTHSNSWFFGWTKHHDPFDPSFMTPALDDTVINYTQRRVAWINEWLIEHFPIDAARVAGQGHSMGSAGVTALGKAYPALFSTITVFNNGFEGPNAADDDSLSGALVSQGHNLFGPAEDDLPTNLRRANGETVPIYDAFDLTSPLSPTRDLPLYRVLHGKHDTNGTMSWDAFVVEQYRSADSLALGMHLYWDERMHGVGAIPSHFTHGNATSQQTGRDDVAYQGRYRSDASYPAFFNHRLYPDSHEPGDGTPGTTADPAWSGDDWGTWGGFHDWDPASIVDGPTAWECPFWLIGQSTSLPDNCPYDSLTCDVAIRRPQSFSPTPGTSLRWAVTSATGDTVQSGESVVAPDGLATAAGVRAVRAPAVRWLSFSAEAPTAARAAAPTRDMPVALAVAASPVHGKAEFALSLVRASHVRLTLHDVRGRRVAVLADRVFGAGEYALEWQSRGVASGVYFALLEAEGTALARRLVVLR